MLISARSSLTNALASGGRSRICYVEWRYPSTLSSRTCGMHQRMSSISKASAGRASNGSKNAIKSACLALEHAAGNIRCSSKRWPYGARLNVSAHVLRS